MIISLAQASINKKIQRCSFAYNKEGGKKQEQQGLKIKILSLLRVYPLNFHLIQVGHSSIDHIHYLKTIIVKL